MTPRRGLGKGRSLNFAGRPSEALRAYDVLLSYEQGNPEAYNGRGLALAALGRYADAITSYDHAIDLQTHFVYAYTNKATALRALHRTDEAISAYQRALSLDTEQKYAKFTLYNLGLLLKELESFKRALVTFEEAVSLDPAFGLAMYEKANTLLAMNRYEEGLMVLEPLLETEANNGKAHFLKGILLHFTKRYKEAMVSYRKAQFLGFSPPFAQEQIHRTQRALHQSEDSAS